MLTHRSSTTTSPSRRRSLLLRPRPWCAASASFLFAPVRSSSFRWATSARRRILPPPRKADGDDDKALRRTPRSGEHSTRGPSRRGSPAGRTGEGLAGPAFLDAPRRAAPRRPPLPPDVGLAPRELDVAPRPNARLNSRPVLFLRGREGRVGRRGGEHEI